MGVYVAGFRSGGRRPLYLQELLQGGGISGLHVWHRVVGGFPLYWEYPGRFPSQGGPTYGKDASEEGRDSQLYLSTAGRGNEGSVYGVGVGVIPPPP